MGTPVMLSLMFGLAACGTGPDGRIGREPSAAAIAAPSDGGDAERPLEAPGGELVGAPVPESSSPNSPTDVASPINELCARFSRSACSAQRLDGSSRVFLRFQLYRQPPSSIAINRLLDGVRAIALETGSFSELIVSIEERGRPSNARISLLGEHVPTDGVVGRIDWHRGRFVPGQEDPEQMPLCEPWR